jgi:serine/threonine protein kinase
MPRPNDKIGPYTLISKLGRGAFGVVWLAEKRTAITTTKVAIKIPNDEDVDLEAVKQEASLWVHASGHPNVLPIIDADIHDEQVIIVSEYAPDGSLSKWLEKHGGKAPSIESAVEMTLGILAGLEHLHKRGIIHRDLKPDNILLQNETPRLADFGIARILKTTSKSTIATGTPAYMPPEAFDGKRSTRTDIWSVGVIFYQLLIGRLPFQQTDIPSLLMAIVTKEPAPLPDFLPKEIQEVIERALDKNPALRFESADEMRKALRHAIQSAESSGSEIKTRIQTPPAVKSPIPTKSVEQTEALPPSVVEPVSAQEESEQLLQNALDEQDMPVISPTIASPSKLEEKPYPATIIKPNSFQEELRQPQSNQEVTLKQSGRRSVRLPVMIGAFIVLLSVGLIWAIIANYNSNTPDTNSKEGNVSNAPVPSPDTPITIFEKAKQAVDRFPSEWLVNNMQAELAKQNIQRPMDSQDPDFLYLYGRALLLTGDFDGALGAFEQAIAKYDEQSPGERTPQKVDARLARAATALRSGRYSVMQPAINSLNEIVIKDSASVDKMKSEIKGNPLESVDPKFLYQYGRELLLSGDFDGAISAFELAIAKYDEQSPGERTPQKVDARLARAAAALRSGRYPVMQPAINSLNEVLEKKRSALPTPIP